MAAVLGGLAFLVGCGAQERVNEQRPAPPVRISVTIGPDAVTVQPRVVGIGPDRTQRIPQNVNAPQPPIRTDAPLTVAFVTANLTEFDSRLEIVGPADTTSGPLVANGNGTYQADLPTGVYTISAADIPGARPGRLTVGPYRASSQSDVLLP